MGSQDFPGLEDAINEALSKDEPGSAVSSVEVLEGGHSGITLAAKKADTDGVAGVVIKVAPPGRPPRGRHDVLRQAHILDALVDVDGLVVPRVLTRGSGEWTFYVMERCAGEAAEPVLDSSTRVFDHGVVRARAEAAARMLGVLHRQPITAVAGADSETPNIEAELTRWAKVAAAAYEDDAPGISALPDALRATMPSTVEAPVLVHGDYRLGNVLFDGVTPTGIIDWEIWTATTPGVDIGWFLAFCDPNLFPGVGAPVEGMPTADELLATYYSAGAFRIADIDWFHAFGRFKLAAVMAHNLRRHREGRHVDPFQEQLPSTIAALINSARTILDGGR
ncbi:phosphotransferase family protein [Rhodococcus opacus]|uniref:Phosphotransferase family protein n=1 Tax=Rhodococcus opacus TaxID=37919 RepID=A0AAX3YFS5_RHOOP|nr:phosphotransferase family protein [Rhodococcus opacus]MCZ4587745.1 phosphotransferase family protein [Rhodococcus opacus]WLF46894.1 phosphotransferase family protein [Rhodococcus opacus]